MSLSISKILRRHFVLSMLVPFTFGIGIETLFPGALRPVLLVVSSLLCLLLALLTKYNDSKSHIIRPCFFIGAMGMMFSLGSLCMSAQRVNEVKRLCDNSKGDAVLIAHISSEFKTSAYGASCYADVYCLEDTSFTVSDERCVRSQLNIKCCAENLQVGDIIMIPKDAVATGEKNDFAQFVYDRFLNLQGVYAVCSVDTFAYISHSSAHKLQRQAFATNERFKNLLKKTKE